MIPFAGTSITKVTCPSEAVDREGGDAGPAVRPHFDGFSAHGPAYPRVTSREFRAWSTEAHHPIPPFGHSICRAPKVFLGRNRDVDVDALLSCTHSSILRVSPIPVTPRTPPTVGFPPPLWRTGVRVLVHGPRGMAWLREEVPCHSVQR
jgi:hypothetical protein